MPSHTNFFETTKEASMRLRGTVVLYDGQPYTVMAISNHKNDGIFRIYLDPCGREAHKPLPYCGPVFDYGDGHPAFGTMMDQWLDQTPNSGVLRKQMNSPLFDKFRPFPLGMCNNGDSVYYIERQPQRRTEQGLTANMLYQQVIEATPGQAKAKPMGIDMKSQSFAACILGRHPSAEECLKNLLNPKITNDGAAFHRHFALVRGPIGMFFLAYKADIIGLLPSADFSSVVLGNKFGHCKEVVEALKLFSSISIQK